MPTLRYIFERLKASDLHTYTFNKTSNKLLQVKKVKKLLAVETVLENQNISLIRSEF